MKSLATAAALSPIEFNLTVLSGKDKGAVYRLMAPEISMGRGSDNDISFPDDPTCSRKHVRIFLTPEGYRIESVSDKNSLSVNGKVTQSALLTAVDEDSAKVDVPLEPWDDRVAWRARREFASVVDCE